MSNLFSKSRVEAFSDGIFAIIITLLVLEIKVPHIEEHDSATSLLEALLGLLPKFLSWIISFFTVAVIWVNHHKLFTQFKHLDNGIFWWNAVLLLWTTFIPFPTAVVGDYPGNTTSFILYGLVMALMAASFSGMRFYVLAHSNLLEENTDMPDFKKGTYYSVAFGPVLYLLGALAVFVHPFAAFLIFFAIPVYFILTNK